MLEVSNDLLARISVDTEVCGGRPCIKNTRIRVSDIIEMLAENVSKEDILADYPMLSLDDVNAALKYAAISVGHVVLNAA